MKKFWVRSFLRYQKNHPYGDLQPMGLCISELKFACVSHSLRFCFTHFFFSFITYKKKADSNAVAEVLFIYGE